MLEVTLRFGGLQKPGLALRHDSSRLLGHHRKAGHMRLESHVHCSYGNSSDPLHVRGC